MNPHPVRPVGDALVELKLSSRGGQWVALAPEIKLVRAKDEKDAEHEIERVVGEVHDAASCAREKSNEDARRPRQKARKKA